MTKRQCKRAVALIKKDCQIKSKYVDSDGNTCAIGCLALDSGVRFNTLRKNNSAPISWIVGVYRRIKTKFGLDLDQQEAIQHLNDCTSWQTTRRRSIVRYLKSLLP